MLLKQKWFRSLFRRRILIALILVLQMGFLVYVLVSGSRLSQGIHAALTLLSILAVLFIVSKKDKGAYKVLWIFLILSFPIFGGFLYLLVHTQAPTRQMRAQLRAAREKAAPLYSLPGDGYASAQQCLPDRFAQVRYLQNFAGFPIYDGTRVTYFPLGEDMLATLLTQLEKAEKYIFLEFFIIQEGKMWDQILDVLRRKAAQGVRVRVMYDDFGCFFLLPTHFAKQLREMGIECAVFNPFRPLLTFTQNNRDHRKIISIDGKVAFTGGINLADEYINHTHPFGHWKDTAIRLEGEAVRSFLQMFLQMWQVEDRQLSFEPYLSAPIPPAEQAAGWVIPYGDCPLDDQPVGEWVYTHILNQAKRYVHIMTPYLILGHELESALKFAAQRGVEVTILLPGIPDKKLAFALAKGHYKALTEAGVKIYEYAPGFLHAKSFVSDDCRAVVGTVNLDYRSLSHHFECGAFLLDVPAIAAIERDFQETLKRSTRITHQKAAHPGFWWKLGGMLMKAFAPLL